MRLKLAAIDFWMVNPVLQFILMQNGNIVLKAADVLPGTWPLNYPLQIRHETA